MPSEIVYIFILMGLAYGSVVQLSNSLNNIEKTVKKYKEHKVYRNIKNVENVENANYIKK